MDTKSDGWIWGNIILGGVVGAVIDGARGAGFKYPPKFVVILEPEEFANIAPATHGMMPALPTSRRNGLSDQKTRSRCTGDDKDACDRQVKEAEKLRDGN
jgi:hypothetical protein